MPARWLAVAVLAAVPALAAAEPVRMRGTFAPGGQYHVAIREDLSGELTLPAEDVRAAPPPVKVRGHGAFEYDERILDPGTPANPAPRTLRVYRKVDLERTVDDQAQDSTIRPAVRRLVILRNGHREVPFSP